MIADYFFSAGDSTQEKKIKENKLKFQQQINVCLTMHLRWM